MRETLFFPLFKDHNNIFKFINWNINESKALLCQCQRRVSGWVFLRAGPTIKLIFFGLFNVKTHS